MSLTQPVGLSSYTGARPTGFGTSSRPRRLIEAASSFREPMVPGPRAHHHRDHTLSNPTGTTCHRFACASRSLLLLYHMNDAKCVVFFGAVAAFCGLRSILRAPLNLVIYGA